jgi:hypothetical protein
MDESSENALDKAVGVLTRARRLDVYIDGSPTPERYIGHALFTNETHLIINLENGSRIFILRTSVSRLVESDLGAR